MQKKSGKAGRLMAPLQKAFFGQRYQLTARVLQLVVGLNLPLYHSSKTAYDQYSVNSRSTLLAAACSASFAGMLNGLS